MRQHANGHQAAAVAGWPAGCQHDADDYCTDTSRAARLGGWAACRGLPAVSVVLALVRVSSALVGSRCDSNCILTPQLTQSNN